MNLNAAVLAIGGSAAPGDVVKSLTGGRPALAADGHALVLYDDAAAAARDVAGYLRPRAMTMVRFGLHTGGTTDGEERLTGPVVATATRLADLAGPGRLRVSADAAGILGDTVPLDPAGDGSYEMRKR
ncbi:hypothetical protein [Dactylosporangium sp. NPDC000521]|uniref:hypothetical protein n=1 Tax=Dactylosporangium sp. NPDC000521 TaxID=3363975 RepID=UPI0036958066